MNHPFLSIFNASNLATGFDKFEHVIAVMDGEKVVATISPEAGGLHEMMYVGAQAKPIGPAFDAATMRRRVLSVAFNNDEAALGRATVKRLPKKALV